MRTASFRKKDIASQVKSVGLIFKTHLDVGFTDMAAAVTSRYMKDYMPRAADMALRLRNSRTPFVWTTGSWLVTRYLGHARGASLRKYEDALEGKLIRWHAMPFTIPMEMLDEPMLESALRISARLDKRFGLRTAAAKMTDVPGFARGIIPAFSRAGVGFLHIGVNPASTVPDVPKLFRWRHPAGPEIVVCYDSEYGGTCVVPGNAASAFEVVMTGDNHGPPSEEQISLAYESARRRFPRAEVHACTLDDMAAAITAVKEKLPVLTCEIGDTWNHGLAADPWKAAAFRALCRLRRNWIGRGVFDPEKSWARRFDENLLLVSEHTCGLDEKVWMSAGGNFKKVEDCYERSQFEEARVTRGSFKQMEKSWDEQREYLREAVRSIHPPPLRRNASDVLEQLRPSKDLPSGLMKMRKIPALTANDSARWRILEDSSISFGNGRRSTAFGRISYEVFGGEDYDRFHRQYLRDLERNGCWALPDFGKPGIGKIIRRGKSWNASVLHAYGSGGSPGRAVLDLAFPDDAGRRFGAPGLVRIEINLLPDGSIAWDLAWFSKAASRIPEALWFSFLPAASEKATWTVGKISDGVSPYDVVRNGNCRMHAVQDGVRMTDGADGWHFESLDAPLVAMGKPALLDFHNRRPNPGKDGIHFNLYNNIWGTNFPMWYGEDARFRFKASPDAASTLSEP